MIKMLNLSLIKNISIIGLMIFGLGGAAQFVIAAPVSQVTSHCTITGVVFYDINRDGTHGDDEAAIPNIEVTLTGTDVLTQVVSSNEMGVYAFTNLPPNNYTVTVDADDSDLPQDMTLTIANEIPVTIVNVETRFADIGFANSNSIALAVAANPHLAYEGNMAQITYTIHNQSAVTPLNQITLNSQGHGLLLTEEANVNLAPGELYELVIDTPLVGDGELLVAGQVQGYDPLHLAHRASDAAVVDIVKQPIDDTLGILDLQMSVSQSTVGISDTVVYTYTATNETNDDIFGIVLKDDQLGIIAGNSEVPPFDLSAYDQKVYTASATIKHDTTSTASVFGINELDDLVTAQTSISVTTNILPHLERIYLPLILR